VAHIFTASVASAFGLPISRVTLSDLNNDLPGIDRLLDCKKNFRKLWHEIEDPECKTALSRVKSNQTPEPEEGS
jgi:hypothetical protein